MLKILRSTLNVARVVVVGGGIAGVYFISRLLELVKDVEVVLVEPEDHHFFVVGVPMAFGGLVDFQELVFPLSTLRRVRHLKFGAAALSKEKDKPCVRGAREGPVCGDYIVLAPGAVKIGSANYWTLNGARELYNKVASAKAVRFIVNTFTPVIGFQELAYAIKTMFPEKEVSVHVVYASPDYDFLLDAWTSKAREVGVEVSRDPPQWRRGELHVSVPVAKTHPLAANLEVAPTTFETDIERVYLIGDSSLIKLDLPPVGWGALWQATIAAQAVASEILKGYVEVEVNHWGGRDKESFKNWLTYRMTTGTPLIHLRGLYDLWKRIIKNL
jgi:NADH dehydrogenase FAD-containing subunit